MKKVILFYVILTSNLFAEKNVVQLIEDRHAEIIEILNQKNELDEDYRWFQGYDCGLFYIYDFIKNP